MTRLGWLMFWCLVAVVGFGFEAAQKQQDKQAKEIVALKREVATLHEAARAYDLISEEIADNQVRMPHVVNDPQFGSYTHVCVLRPFELDSFKYKFSDGRELTGRELRRILWGDYSKIPDHEPIKFSRLDGVSIATFVPKGFPFAIASLKLGGC